MREELKKYSEFLTTIRQFFSAQNVVEVKTHQLLNHPITDVHIDSIATQVNGEISPQHKYLHTSPELEMKKLLSRGSGDIYQICQVFRDNEQGLSNFNEFTMLEYYRLGFNIHQLMNDIVDLINALGFNFQAEKMSYAQAFFKYADIDILNASFSELKTIAKKYGLTTDFEWIEDLQIFMFTALCEPRLKEIPLCFIYDYPHQQAALAKVESNVAHRFELYINGVEIANGYDELQDAYAYEQRFISDISKRKFLSKYTPELDNDFIDQLNDSLPQCSGVAIGIDRLLSQIN